MVNKRFVLLTTFVASLFGFTQIVPNFNRDSYNQNRTNHHLKKLYNVAEQLTGFSTQNNLSSLEQTILHDYPAVKKPFILIDKSDSKLYFISDKEDFSFPVGFGKKGGKKLEVKDSKTPEGVYYICDIHQSYRNYLFLELSYPNIDDAMRGLKSGLINRKEYEKIIEANKNRVCPPQNTNLGGYIGIHGKSRFMILGKYYESDRLFNHPLIPLLDLTAGCILAKNHDMDRLKNAVEYGIDIIVRD